MIVPVDLFTQAGAFIQIVGSTVLSMIQGNEIWDFLITVMTVFFTLSIIGKLSYQENGG